MKNKRHISANRAANVMGINNKTLVKWIKLKGFPMKALKNPMIERVRWRVDISDMAHWLYKNKYWGVWKEREVRAALRQKLN